MKITLALASAGVALTLISVAGATTPAGAAATGTPAGTAWTVQPTPALPGGSGGALDGVSCPSAGDCWAVGSRGHVAPATGTEHTLAEHWNGTAWTIASTPGPATPTTTLESVSCPSRTDCEAVGYYGNGRRKNSTLAERWNGETWTVQPTPRPSTKAHNASFSAVSCLTPADCTAVGTYTLTTALHYATLAEHWDGHTWTVQPAPELKTSGELWAVSCLVPGWCLATGSETVPGKEFSEPLAEVWNGKTWAGQKVPDPAGSQDGELVGLSCSSRTACTATGDYFSTQASTGVALIERWNGKTWAMQQVKLPSGQPELFAVSCPSASNCTAAGVDNNVSLAVHWNGTTWATQPTPNPGPYGSDLGGVTCTATHCMAVGEHTSLSAGRTLAETN